MGESVEGIETISGHVTALSTMPLREADFAAGPDMDTELQSATQVGSAVMAGKLLTRVDPIYPASAKQNRIEGSVKLHAIIGRDGRIRSLKLLSAPDSSLAVSAIAAVRQWTYTPYVLNGAPTEVDTVVTINFTFGPG
jgi:TonB family protein